MTWQEIYFGGSPEAEEAHVAALARTIVEVQRHNSGTGTPRRTFHAKIVAGVEDATVTFGDGLPAGPYTAGRSFPATVRLSNANGLVRPDTEPDLRGAAVKLHLPDGTEHDLLMTSYPVSHARDAAQFVRIAKIGAGPRALAPLKLAAAFGLGETVRIVRNLREATRTSVSVAGESYWSRGAVLWGDAGPVRLRLSPVAPVAPRPDVPQDAPDRLTLDMAARLREAPVEFALSVQRYVDERVTPIEDGAVAWPDEGWIRVATLTLPVGELSERVDGVTFNPWNAPDEFRPLGSLNRARRVVYAASARTWRV